MDCRLGGGVISDRASFSDALTTPHRCHSAPHCVHSCFRMSRSMWACLVWNSPGSTPPAMDTRSRAPSTRTFTVINVIIVCPDGFDNSYTSAKRSTHNIRSIRRIFVSNSILLCLWRKCDNQMSDFITRETVFIKEDPWNKTAKVQKIPFQRYEWQTSLFSREICQICGLS